MCASILAGIVLLVGLFTLSCALREMWRDRRKQRDYEAYVNRLDADKDEFE